MACVDIESLKNKLRDDIKKNISNLIESEHVNRISEERILQERNSFLQNKKKILNDSFSKQIFSLFENKEVVWRVNPIFFEKNQDLEELLYGTSEKILCPKLPFEEYKLPRASLENFEKKESKFHDFVAIYIGVPVIMHFIFVIYAFIQRIID